MKAFCTIVTPSHLPYAWVLGESLRETGNSEPLHVLLVGGDRPANGPSPAGCTVLTLDELSIPYPALMRHYFSAFELCNALKPFLVTHLFEHLDCTDVIYLDSDLFVTASFEPVWRELSAGTASLLLTPHHFNPPPLDAGYTSEVDVVDLGFLNGGFAAWRGGPATRRMLAWMCERFPVYGFYRHLGMAADQKLLPLLLSYFPDDVRIWRHPGLNIAYWNAHERAVVARDGRWTCDGLPVFFFHMSGYKLDQPGLPCAYVAPEANRRLLAGAPWLSQVMADYRERLSRAFAGHKPEPYRYTHYDGVKLNPDYRRLLFRAGRLDRRDRVFWSIWITVRLRMIKRLLTGVRPLS